MNRLKRSHESFNFLNKKVDVRRSVHRSIISDCECLRALPDFPCGDVDGCSDLNVRCRICRPYRNRNGVLLPPSNHQLIHSRQAYNVPEVLCNRHIATDHCTPHGGGQNVSDGVIATYICSRGSTRRMLLNQKTLAERILLHDEYNQCGHQSIWGDCRWPSLIPKTWQLLPW